MLVAIDALLGLLTDDMLARMRKVADPLVGPSESEDAVSEAVTYLLARCQRAPITMENPRAYLVSCSYHAATRILRQRLRHTPTTIQEAAVENAVPVFGATAAELVGDPQIDRVDVGDCVRQLPERCRVAIVLQHWGDLSNADIAERTGVSVKAVEKRLQDARRLLAQCLPIGE